MTADEMIDMMPSSLWNWIKIYTKGTFHDDFIIWYCCEWSKPILYWRENAFVSPLDICVRTLIRLLTNNYLSDYILITLHNEEENQVNNW